MSRLFFLLATLVVSMTAPALAAEGPTNCYHLRCDTGPLQIQAPVPHLSSDRARG
jgi:hypothetical protein